MSRIISKYTVTAIDSVNYLIKRHGYMIVFDGQFRELRTQKTFDVLEDVFNFVSAELSQQNCLSRIVSAELSQQNQPK